MAQKKIEIHQNFADWMRKSDLGTDRETLENRWKGVEKLVDNGIEDGQLNDLINAVFMNNIKDIDLGWFQTAFKEEDDLFSMDAEHNLTELIDLATATLTYYLEQYGDQDKIALRIITSSCGGHRKPKGSAPLLAIANSTISEASKYLRNREDPEPKLLKPFANEFIDGLTEGSNPFADQPKFIAVLKELKRVINSLVQTNNECTRSLRSQSKTIKLQDEEIDILWWLIGGYSEILNLPFEKISQPLKFLVLGVEISNRLRCVAEPPSLRSLLIRSGAEEDSLTKLKGLVSSCTEVVPIITPTDQACPTITPLFFALQCLSEGGPEGWVERWQRASQMKNTIELSPLDWAVQACRESLLLRTHED